MSEKVWVFPYSQRLLEHKDEGRLEVRAEDEREAVLTAVGLLLPCLTGDPVANTEAAEKLIVEELGEGWTPEAFYEARVDIWSGDYLFTLEGPVRVSSEDDRPQNVMRRALDRYYEEGMIEHIFGRLKHAVENMTDDEIERVFGEDLDTQREVDECDRGPEVPA